MFQNVTKVREVFGGRNEFGSEEGVMVRESFGFEDKGMDLCEVLGFVRLDKTQFLWVEESCS